MFFFFSFNPYIAIIGDIKGSRKLEDRKVTQDKLVEVLNEINEKYKHDISSKFMITLGDEFQGLLNSGENVMSIIFDIEQKMYPVKIRFGVGIGEITTKINTEMAIGADGPGYYKARDAVKYLKENEMKNKTNASNIRIGVDGDNENTAIMLNTILSLLTAIKELWTDRQREIIWDMLAHQDGQKNAAVRLNITQSTVQKSLSYGKYYAYKEAIETIEKALGEIRRKDV
ncbi:MAG: SatD family protein [Bacillota bacterium]|nr:SatD family protein [Bacillota bacterium]